MRYIILMLSLTLCVQAQPHKTFYVARMQALQSVPAFFPTNVGTPFAWFNPDSVSNAAGTVIASWTNECNAALILTNTTGIKIPLSSNRNNHATLVFTNSYLSAYNWEIPQRIEFWAALNIQPDTASERFIWRSTNGFVTFSYTTTGNLKLVCNANAQTNFLATNNWMTMCVVLDGARNAVLTNNVMCLSGVTGNIGLTNMVIGSGTIAAGGTALRMDLGDLIVYSETNTGANRLLIHQYLTNKYAITIP